MSEETKNTAQEEETTDTPVTEETVENEPEVVENGEAETEEIPVEDGDEEASQDDKKDSKSKTSLKSLILEQISSHSLSGFSFKISDVFWAK